MTLTLGILPPGCQQEIFNFVNLARLQWGKKTEKCDECSKNRKQPVVEQ